MRKFVIGAALAVVACFGALALAGPTNAFEVHDAAAYVDPAVVYNSAGQEVLGAPTLRAAEQRAELTQFVPDQTVEVGWGDMLSDIIKSLAVVILAFAVWLLRKAPASFTGALDMIAGMMGQGRANELLEKAINYGVNATAGAVQGKTMKVAVGNEVLERAFEYALRHAPGVVANLGGSTMLREKIMARLDLDESAALPTPKPGLTLTSKLVEAEPVAASPVAPSAAGPLS